MLDKFLYISYMVTANPELGTDLFAFNKPYDTEKVCLEQLESDPNKYFTVHGLISKVNYDQTKDTALWYYKKF